MLSQAEIDALLGAVADGTLPAEDQPPSLSADGRIVKTYDFRRPAKFSNEQLRTLQAIHENVGRVAAARLSSFLRGSVVIQLAGTDQSQASRWGGRCACARGRLRFDLAQNAGDVRLSALAGLAVGIPQQDGRDVLGAEAHPAQA